MEPTNCIGQDLPRRGFIPKPRVAYSQPWVNIPAHKFTPKGLHHSTGIHLGSIPYITLVPVETILFEQATKLVLERHLSMVLFLIGDVAAQQLHMTGANRERPVTTLPIEIHKGGRFCLEPLGRVSLQLLDQVGHRNGSTQPAENMDVVRCPTHP